MATKSHNFWSRDDVRLAALVVVLGAFGMSLIVGAVWLAFMLWNRDFRRRFGNWYTGWVLAGLVAAWLLVYPVSGRLNVPPSWVAFLLVAAGAVVGVEGRRRKQKRRPWL